MTISDIAALDAARILQWSGGLGPDQHHVAVLGADAAHRLADNYRKGIHDDGTCFAG
ncbi:hypothetical protein BZL30_4223 [Mycobacterium kansasii]|nr:hypothetical protein BZL30_4223 [Mycobacterium kansasii]